METAEILRHPPAGMDIGALHELRIGWLERSPGQVVALASDYPAGYLVPLHQHGRSQLLHALSGVVTVATSEGRWMVPPEHALWIPAGVPHSVEMLGAVMMRSLYVVADAIAGLPERCRVVGMTELMRSLIVEAVTLPFDYESGSRAALVMALILQEIPRLPEKPLGLPFPTDPRFAELCRGFVEAPSPRARIDDWADALAMSRRTFTRAFRRETGVSLSTWRQQCCLFAALPRLARGEPVTSVAFDLGYDSVAAFTTMFKRMLGAPPRDYLREGPKIED
ncbi:helix-turn-helix domain-containing protein [Methylocapsa sp. S129]|uniref:AraC family transcriptional regulator n=1 Tax=Methylocapsa sp. S129 TaxID=1641869 RepID=UPI00131D05DB|nr:helix-turn-helix transcriptional regulator [Methylocapsa sp. S129]